MTRFLVPALLVALTACDGGDTDLDTDVDTATDVDTGTDTDPGTDTDVGTDTDAGTDADDCDNNGFTAGVDEFTYLTGFNSVFYTTVTREAHPNDGLNIELYFDLGATDGPHTHTFSPTDTLQDCHTCLTVAQNCSDVSTCERQFLADGGELVVTELTAEDGATFSGELRNVTLREVTIDGSGQSTPVDGGQNWCIDGFTFSGTLQ